MIDMIGIGPFVVSPLVIRAMGGPQALLAWAAGAILALLDGFVWSELGAALPRAGGSYVFLREAYGPEPLGAADVFSFVWQTLIQAPLVIASGAIGFSQYASYLHPFSAYQQKAISGAVVLLLVALLIPPHHHHRKNLRAALDRCDRHYDLADRRRHNPLQSCYGVFISTRRVSPLAPVFRGLGAAMVSTTYAYWGYYNICHLGGELRDPQKNIPRGIFISIFGIAVIYLAMQTSILA